MTVLVTGSRGTVGSTLISLLRAAGTPVRAASAAPEKLDLPPDVATVRLSLDDPETFPAALAGVRQVFLYANPAHIDAFLTDAKAAGVEHIVLLSSSSVLYAGAEDNPIARHHLAVEQALKASDIDATFLRPGAFAGNAAGWAWSIRSTGTVALPYPGTQASPIHEADVADAAHAVLAEPRLRGAAYHLTGPESLTATEQIAALAAATGREIAVETVSPEAWKESMAAYMDAAVADALLAYFASYDGRPDAVTRGVEELTARPSRTFAAWAAENAEAFRP
ncbi:MULTISPECIES: NAD(P)H-binding protein [unclassified Streptomyces]|uniref:NAD(P)H-binding protein n=1 Tax=Streptomyces sp. NBC_00060 TaxID=2975636 RepID=A0AAU2GZ14_9ACTN